MTSEEYEALYRGAIEQLMARGLNVGAPYRSDDGVRFVRVNDRPHSDKQVFKTTWGKSTAEQIENERAAAL